MEHSELNPDMVVLNPEDFDEFLASRGDITTADQVGAVPLYDGRLVQFLITSAVKKGTTSYRQGRKWFKVSTPEVVNVSTPVQEGPRGDAGTPSVGVEPAGIEQSPTIPETIGPTKVDGLSRPGGVGTSGTSESSVVEETT